MSAARLCVKTACFVFIVSWACRANDEFGPRGSRPLTALLKESSRIRPNKATTPSIPPLHPPSTSNLSPISELKDVGECTSRGRKCKKPLTSQERKTKAKQFLRASGKFQEYQANRLKAECGRREMLTERLGGREHYLAYRREQEQKIINRDPEKWYVDVADKNAAKAEKRWRRQAAAISEAVGHGDETSGTSTPSLGAYDSSAGASATAATSQQGGLQAALQAANCLPTDKPRVLADFCSVERLSLHAAFKAAEKALDYARWTGTGPLCPLYSPSPPPPLLPPSTRLLLPDLNEPPTSPLPSPCEASEGGNPRQKHSARE